MTCVKEKIIYYLDHDEERLARARHALGRKDDLVEGGLDVRRGQRIAVVELHALADLEGVCLAAIGRPIVQLSCPGRVVYSLSHTSSFKKTSVPSAMK